MKKTRLTAMMLALILAISLTVSGAIAENKTGTVFGGWLILRSSPSFNGAIRSSYPTGTKVTITGQKGSWYAVRTPDGLSGYMLGNYLKVSGGTNTTIGETNAYVTSKNGLNVRLRTGPGTGYRILATYAPGTNCTILSSGTYWSKILIGTQTGYMMSEYLTTKAGSSSGSSSAPAPAPSGDEYDVWVTSKNGKGVNMRAGAGKNYKSIGFYSVGTKASMITRGNLWSYIRIGNRTGYMMTEFLTANSPTPIVYPVLSGSYVTSANGKAVNLRKGPGKSFGIINSFKVGTPLTVMSRGDEWYFVHIGQVYGYMMKQFVHESDGTSATQTDLAGH